MRKECLRCGLRFSDTADFCPNCGRPVEKPFRVRTTQDIELASPHREMMGTDNPEEQLGFSRDDSDLLVHRGCLYCSLEFSDTISFCPSCGRPAEKDAR
ncbi:MAG: zinc ribbon domain-containing protein, partial [Ktedonobacteraceae bacterium]|nr:zinc ribbon domain-containing protein [Ktedonobacteraceae bacterium]